MFTLITGFAFRTEQLISPANSPEPSVSEHETPFVKRIKSNESNGGIGVLPRKRPSLKPAEIEMPTFGHHKRSSLKSMGELESFNSVAKRSSLVNITETEVGLPPDNDANKRPSLKEIVEANLPNV